MRFDEAKPHIRLLIFDLDGTLIDSKEDLARSVNATLVHLGRPVLDQQTIYSYVGRGAPTLIRRVVGEVAAEAEVAAGLEYFLDYYWEHKLEHTRLYPGVWETLGQLADGGPQARTLAVLTNKPVRVSREILAGLGVLDRFQFVFGGNSFETKKPDPLGARTLLERTGAPAHAAMIVGDSQVDIQTAANAGIWSCGVTYGFGTLEPEAGPPDLLIHSFPELPAALAALSPAAGPQTR
jgi:phosphoglycolate phosphatase